MKRSEAIEKLRSVIRRKHLSIATENNYAQWLTRFARFVVKRSPTGTPEQKMERFLTQLAKQGVAAATQNQAFCALLFFYREVQGVQLGKVDSLRAKRPIHLRYAPEVDEVRRLLLAVQNVGGYPTRLIVKLIYGCGLRVSEPLNLRLKDVLLSESKLVIRAAKGGKDRFVVIPCALVSELTGQVAVAKAISGRDRLNQVPLALPGLLAKKYPHWQFSPKWAWLFPGNQPCRHPRTGETVRWRCLEVNVQRAVKTAARPLGLEITPHNLRHAYATHCLNDRENPRAIQQAMGHQSLETTMGYLHAEALSVRSPLDVTI